MKRYKSSSLQTSPFKRSHQIKLDQPFTNIKSTSPFISRSMTPVRKVTDFYNMKQLRQVKDVLQEQFQTESNYDNATTNQGTPNNNRSVMTKPRSNSASKINQSIFNQFLTPQSSRIASPQPIVQSQNYIKLNKDMIKKTKQMRTDMEIYAFLKDDTNFKLRKIKNSNDPFQEHFLAEKHDEKDLMKNLKLKEKQYNMQKTFLIDQIQQRRFKKDKADRDQMYRQLSKQQQINHQEELKKDKIILDSLVTNAFRKFTGSINLYNLYYTGAINEPDHFCTKKSMKVQTGYILPQKQNNQSDLVSSQGIFSKNPSLSNASPHHENLKLSLTKKISFQNKQEKPSNPPSMRSIQSPNPLLKQKDSIMMDSVILSPTKRNNIQPNKLTQSGILSPKDGNNLQQKQSQLIENVIQYLQKTNKSKPSTNIFTYNQQLSQTERIQNLKGVLKQRQQDLYDSNQLQSSDSTVNIQNKDQNNYQSVNLIKSSYSSQLSSNNNNQYLQQFKQQHSQPFKIQMKQQIQENQKQIQVPPLQLTNLQQQDQIQEETENTYQQIVQRSPQTPIRIDFQVLSKRLQQNKQRTPRVNSQDQQQNKHPIDKLDELIESSSNRLSQLKQFQIDEDFFSPVHEKYKLQIQEIQKFQTKEEDKFFQNIRQNKIQKVKEDLQRNPQLISSYDNHLYTGLHWAVKRNYPELAKLLVESGSNLNIKDYKNRTPYDLAVEQGYFHITKIINQ